MNTNDRVLIVDDDPSLLAALVRHLGERFTIVTTECGENALELIRTQAPFAVMLCDMRMPGMDGIEVLRRAMVRNPTDGGQRFRSIAGSHTD